MINDSLNELIAILLTSFTLRSVHLLPCFCLSSSVSQQLAFSRFVVLYCNNCVVYQHFNLIGLDSYP
jgi:hypothetical protein